MTYAARSLFFSLLFTLGALSARAADKSPEFSCGILSESTQARLTAYIAKLIKAAPDKPPKLLSFSAENESCFRRLIFQSPDQKAQFRLFLSPDQRFLEPQLFDSNVDPVIAEARSLQITRLQIDKYAKRTKRPSLGGDTAPVTIAVFSDLECPFCRRAMDILETHVVPAANGKVRIVFMNYPLSSHRWAVDAALALSCVASRSSEEFWRLHDYVFRHQSEINTATVAGLLANQIKQSSRPGFDVAEVMSCIQGREGLEQVKADADFGSELGVTATPTLFINGRRVVGIENERQATDLVDAALAQADVGNAVSR